MFCDFGDVSAGIVLAVRAVVDSEVVLTIVASLNLIVRMREAATTLLEPELCIVRIFHILNEIRQNGS